MLLFAPPMSHSFTSHSPAATEITGGGGEFGVAERETVPLKGGKGMSDGDYASAIVTST